ncbi:hypothetical protein F4821DRAFT_255725 [Hypoxylon rubiginosum]|uniref:Uncharacterized protein n=1 Tax=Hypoxylon rubiginosum TaxID=110542 RepID=A0ACC0DCK6_9PEZI|nr:hypothetical protein F4821DRAFT_255725 [Hypoxylon rubiginosum]
MTEEKPTILVFKSSDPAPNSDNDIVQNLREKANVYEVDDEKSYGYSKLLSNHPSARAIFVLKSNILAPKYEHLWDQMSDYVDNGGTVVLSRSFVNATQRPDLEEWILKTWCKPWEWSLSMDPGYAVFQGSAIGPRASWRNGLAAAYSISPGLFLFNVHSSDIWYSSVRCGFADEVPTFVAFAQIGLGWLGWAGDINNIDDRTTVVLAMMGLN